MRFQPIMESTKLIGYLVLICITKHTSALTGLCQTEIGRATCFACSSISYPISELANAPRDCCGDPYVYSVCERCLFDPDSCIDAERTDKGDFDDELGDSLENSAADTEQLLMLTNVPDRRSKYFLGKRDNTRAFLGKRDNTRAFLGKRDNTRAFLGKRDNTRAFLGKRSEQANIPNSDVEAALAEEEHQISQLLSKRPNPFLGKRISYLLQGETVDPGYFENSDDSLSNAVEEEKRANPFLGKRDDEAKRANPFLGKRESIYTEPLEQDPDDLGYFSDDDEKRANPFLGKRSDETKRANPFLGKRDPMQYPPLEDDVFKRSNPFLGKRGSQYFLGKRVGSSQPTMEEIKNLYMRPLARRAKYFLGKRSEGENGLLRKRQKYFLGKRDVEKSSSRHAEDFVNTVNDTPLSQELNKDKTQDHSLDKRSVNDLSDTMTSSELVK